MSSVLRKLAWRGSFEPSFQCNMKDLNTNKNPSGDSVLEYSKWTYEKREKINTILETEIISAKYLYSA